MSAAPTEPHSSVLLHGARLADGTRADVRLDGERIAAVLPDVAAGSGRTEPDVATAAHVVDLSGFVLLPAPAEPHAHLDKALTADLVPNPAGDLLGAIRAWNAFVPTLTRDGIAARAEQAVHELVASGATAIRTHVNVHGGLELTAVEAMLEVRDRVRHLCDLELVILTGFLTGDDGAVNEPLWRAAVRLDPDIVVGGCPHLDDDPLRATDMALELAGEEWRKLDLHTDETLDPSHLELRYLAQRVAASGFATGAAASHCVSLGVQPVDVQRAVSAEVAASGVAVITLPQTNLFLQARGIDVAPPRGLTAIAPLLDAGATVGAGADNVRDPFNLMGRSDPLETAALLVMAGHCTVGRAWQLVSGGAREAIGLPPVAIAPGQPAELLAVRGESLGDAIARADQERMVWHRGRLVAHTRLERTLAPR